MSWNVLEFYYFLFDSIFLVGTRSSAKYMAHNKGKTISYLNEHGLNMLEKYLNIEHLKSTEKLI